MPAVDRLGATFAALANPTRRAIPARLLEGDASVAELAEPFRMTPRAVSKHIGVLAAAGLVTRGRDAQRRPSRIRAEPLLGVDRWLGAHRRLWNERFDRLDGRLAAQQSAPSTSRAELVFENWTAAEHLTGWLAPSGFTVTACEVAARPGGAWRVAYRSGAGEEYVESGDVELVRPERVVLTITQESGGAAGPRTTVTVTLRAVGPKTEVTFVQTGFDSARRRDDHREGWGECLAKLDGLLTARG